MEQQQQGGIRAYAAHRKRLGLPGGTHGAVQRAIQSRRLARAVRPIPGGVLIDFAAADQEWAANTSVDAETVKLRAQLDPRSAGKAAAAGRLTIQDVGEEERPVPIERLSVDVEDVDMIGIGAWFDLQSRSDDPDPRDKFFIVDVAGARWLAGELLKAADAGERLASKAASDDGDNAGE